MKISWKKTIAISSMHESQLRRIKDALDFDTEMVAYKFCLTYAIANNLEDSTDPQIQRGTKWASGNFDDEEEVSHLLKALFPEEDDHQTLMMGKAEAGIERIHHLVDEFDVCSLTELLDVSA
jgi:hypothetical protein|tara:strand:+ start:202 stop:567 length:366 start_codon:yes stop_codon:yes gene_type:complete